MQWIASKHTTQRQRYEWLIVMTCALAISACVAAPGATAGGQQPFATTTLALVNQGDLWLLDHTVRPTALTHIHDTTPHPIWSTPLWSPDRTRVAATFNDTSVPDAPRTLVIIDITSHATVIASRSIDSHHTLAGWITDDWLLVTGDVSTPGLSAYSVLTQANVSITPAPVAAVTISGGAVWYVARQQPEIGGAWLMRWESSMQTPSTITFLPTFVVNDQFTACGTIQLSADTATLLYSSDSGSDGTPCQNPNGAWVMSLDHGTANRVFAFVPNQRYLLDPNEHWVAAITIAADHTINGAVQQLDGAQQTITLPTIAFGGDNPTLAVTQNRIAISAVDATRHDYEDVVLLPTNGQMALSASIAATSLAFAPDVALSLITTIAPVRCSPAPLDTAPDPTMYHIAILGDSIAQGWGTSIPSQCSFGAQLATMSAALGDGAAPVQILTRATGGYRTDQMLSAVPDLVAFAPDLEIIELGTNDEREGWPLDKTGIAYATVLAQLRAATGTHVAHPLLICLSIWPSPGFDRPEVIAPYNALIAQACTDAGGTTIDITSDAIASMSDGAIAPNFNWHPNDRGALTIDQFIISALNHRQATKTSTFDLVFANHT